MSSFNANSQMYNISTENEVAAILSHFNSDFVLGIVDYNFNNRLSGNVLPIPNIIGSFEQNFKDIKTNYNSNLLEIERVRLETYKEIIEFICNKYGAKFNYNDDLDLYSSAYYIYDFFISNYYNNLVNFLSTYIYKERNGIYESMGLYELKKNKDSSTIYGKKIYKDIKLAVINANLEYVLQNMMSYDIDIINILYMIYDKNIAMFLLSIVQFNYLNGDFYKNVYMSILNTEYKANLITSIRLEIQKMSIDVCE